MSALFPAAPDWAAMPVLEILSPPILIAQDCVELNTNSGSLHLQIFDQGIRLRSARTRPYDYGLLPNEPVYRPLTISGTPARSVIESPGLSLYIEHKPFSFEIGRAHV